MIITGEPHHCRFSKNENDSLRKGLDANLYNRKADLASPYHHQAVLVLGVSMDLTADSTSRTQAQVEMSTNNCYSPGHSQPPYLGWNSVKIERSSLQDFR